MAAALLAAAGCIVDDGPSEARATFTGEPGIAVRIVLSARFGATVESEDVTRVTLVEADTLVRTLPFDTVYGLGGEGRFFAQTTSTGPAVQTFRLRVSLDGEQVHDEWGQLTTQTPFRFLHVFGRNVARGVEVR